MLKWLKVSRGGYYINMDNEKVIKVDRMSMDIILKVLMNLNFNSIHLKHEI